MRNLTLTEKTGFLTSVPFVITDRRGIEFYNSDYTTVIERGETLKFNMPIGEFIYDGSFVKLDSPIPTKNIILPKPERNKPQRTYKIIFDHNPDKCSIFYQKGIILFDISLKNAPLYTKHLIYFHEFGHHFYKSEDKADLYAVKKCLEIGYNPSQIGRAALTALSEKSIDRIQKIIDTLTKNKG